MSLGRLIKYIIFFSVISGSIQSQNELLIFNSLDNQEGLSSTLNANFGLDSDSYFWSSSRAGLIQYDGLNTKSYIPTFQGVEVDPNINGETFTDKNGVHWFTSNTALHKIIPGTDSLQSFRFHASENTYYYAFHLEGRQFLWLIANQQLFRVDLEQLPYQVNPLFDFPVYEVKVATNEQGKVTKLIRPLLEQRYGVEIIRLEDQKIIQRDSFFDASNSDTPPSRVAFIHVENENSFWLPSSRGLIHLYYDKDIPKFKVYAHTEKVNFQDQDLQEIAPWKERYFWCASLKNGLFLFDKNLKKFIRQDTLAVVAGRIKSLQKINKIKVDTFNNIWLSIFGQGFVYANLNNLKFGQGLPLEMLANNNEFSVHSISEDNTSLYFGTTDQGLLKTRSNHSPNNSNFTSVKKNNDRERLLKTYIDTRQFIWFLGTNKTYVRSSNGTSRSLPISAVRIIENDQGEIFVLDNQSLYKLTVDSEAISFRQTQLSSIYLPAQIFFDSTSQLLMVSQGDNQLRIFSSVEPLIEEEAIKNIGIVNSIFRSQSGDFIWMATSTGLFKYFPESHSTEEVKLIFPNGSIPLVGILEDQFGAIWMSSYDGIYRYDPVKEELESFGPDDGIFNTNFIENACLRSRDGRLFFGSQSGVSFIDPKRFRRNQNPPKIILEDILVNGRSYLNELSENDNSLPPLGYRQNRLKVQYHIIEYGAPKANVLKSLLIKNEKDTLLVSDLKSLELYSLSPGNYELISEAFNSDNYSGGQQKSLIFNISPPWYKQWEYQLLILILLLLGIYQLYKYRIRQIKQKEAQKRKEAEYKQLVAETETAVLRLQMNPHFIFNSMNSINSFILQKDTTKANEYLESFARLMRQILEMSEQQFTEISEEIDFLELYLETEMMRLKGKLSYSFEIDENLDPDMEEIPTMILQPFVENAIWHGIAPKKEGGHISIRFSIEKQTIICEVEDNGVGRNTNKASALKNHKSKAIDITQRRLNLLMPDNLATDNLQIIDLKDTNGSPLGTKIKIYIPILSD